MAKISLLNPTAELKVKSVIKDLKSFDTLQGATLGFLANGKTWGFTFFEELGSIFKKKFKLSQVKLYRKENSNSKANPELLDKLSESCDAVVDGIQD